MSENLSGGYPPFFPEVEIPTNYFPYVAFCNDVYNEDPNLLDLPEGWQTFCDSKQLEVDQFGYFGRCYIVSVQLNTSSKQ